MMEDLAMHILELLQNSIEHQAKIIKLEIIINPKHNTILINLFDNGAGISKDKLALVTKPFVTSRKTRNVGLGLAFMQGLCDLTEGILNIKSEIDKFTKISIKLPLNHLDLPPLGDLGQMMMFAIQANDQIDYLFTYQYNEQKFILDTKKIKEEIAPLSICDNAILLWVKQYINENIEMRKD